MSGEENGREYEDKEACACRLNARSKACCFSTWIPLTPTLPAFSYEHFQSHSLEPRASPWTVSRAPTALNYKHLESQSSHAKGTR